MPNNAKRTDAFYLVGSAALPDVFSKVIEVKRLMESGEARSVQEAVARVGISRSAFYKYKDCVFDYSEADGAKKITFAFNLEDTPGLLSNVLNVIAQCEANVLTINQTIPIGGVANITMTVAAPGNDAGGMFERLERARGVRSLRILARS